MAQLRKSSVALATVVHVEGSAYRREGARMLIGDNGQLTGAISGGCLEGETLRKAMLVMQHKKTMLVTFDSMDDDDSTLSIGLGCNGVVQILIEPVDFSDEKNPVEFLKKISERRQEAILITLFAMDDKRGLQPGTVILNTRAEQFSNLSFYIAELFTTIIGEAYQKKHSLIKKFKIEDRHLTAFIDYIVPPVSLIVAGGGNDVIPLVNMAQILGWKTTIVDGRPAYAKAARFASTCSVLNLEASKVAENMHFDQWTVFLLMSHNYKYDLAVLGSLLQKNISYIGILGPKKKYEQMLRELSENGINVSSEKQSHIFSPMGLNIGAESPEEIALSIVSEIQSVLSAKDALPLRNLENPMHQADRISIEKISS